MAFLYRFKTSIQIPKNQYITEGEFTKNDIFIYKPYKISLMNTYYIISILISQSSRLIGFVNYKKVYDSLNCSAILALRNDLPNHFHDVNYMKTYEKSIYSHFMYILYYFNYISISPSKESYRFISHYTQMANNDIIRNHYLLEYLLSNEEKLRSMTNFYMFGKGDERILRV